MREVPTLSGMGHGGVYTFWRVQSYKSRNATRDAFRRITVDEACSFQSDPSLPKLPSIRAGTIDRRPLLGLVPCEILLSIAPSASPTPQQPNVSQDGTQSPSESWRMSVQVWASG
ncbi:hypothetical protein E4U32_005908 [Claviceps aff. humidiphila group G2b]|nr:hypothetical protein E4U32_005908 [Claviceps aff. humidiphila group G2b]